MSESPMPHHVNLSCPTSEAISRTGPGTLPGESPIQRTALASLLSFINLGLKIGSNLLLIPLSLRFLGQEEYGLWIVLQSVGTCLAMSELGIGQTILNYQSVAFAKQDYEGVNRILATVFGLYWLIVIPVGILSVLFIVTQPVEQWLIKDSSSILAPAIKPLLVLTAILALMRVPGNVFPATLLGLREISLRQVIESILVFSLTVGTVLTLVLGGKLLALLLATNLVWILVPAFSYPFAKSRHNPLQLRQKHWTPSLLWPLFGNSLFFFLYGIGLLFQRLAGNLIVGRFVGLDKVPAFFALVTLFRIVGWSLADILSQTMQPYIIMFEAQGRHERVVFFAGLCGKLTSTLAIIYAATIWLFAETGLQLWLGHGMFLGYGTLALFAGSFLIDVLFLTTNNFMRGLNHHRGISFVMAGYAALSLLLGLAGAEWWKAQNPIYGLCLGLFLASLLGQAVPIPPLTQRWLQVGWRAYLGRFVIPPVFLAFCGVLILSAFSLIGVGRVWARPAYLLVLALILGLLTWHTVLDREERAWMASLFAKGRASLSEALSS